MVTIRNHYLILDAEFIRQLHPKVQYELGKISGDNQLKFEELYSQQKRSLRWAYACLIFFPSTHYAFLGRWQMQGLFWLTLGGGLLWWLADIYRLPDLVKQANYDEQLKALREINSVNVFVNARPAGIPSMVTARLA